MLGAFMSVVCPSVCSRSVERTARHVVLASVSFLRGRHFSLDVRVLLLHLLVGHPGSARVKVLQVWTKCRLLICVGKLPGIVLKPTPGTSLDAAGVIMHVVNSSVAAAVSFQLVPEC